jgi:hypothetical protein
MNRIQKKFICDALEHEHMLSEWESQFINDLAEKPDDYELSKRQNEVLNRISQKINGGG